MINKLKFRLLSLNCCKAAYFCFMALFYLSIQAQASQNVSPLDASYRLSRVTKNASSQVNQASIGVSAYREGLSKSISSECKWYPSDSSYAQLVHQNCGSLKASLLAFERFTREPDAYQMVQKNFIVNNQLVFEDLPYDCELF